MKLLQIKADSFGPLRGEWNFAPDKLNLVVDDNERGKSSLLAAISAALYGLEDDRRSHRVMTPLDRWRPWAGGTFRVELELEVLARRVRIVRDFERGTVAVFDGAGREITHEFLDGKDEYPVGRKLLGVDAAEFEKCAMVRQGELDAVVPGDEKARRASTLRARLENAADTHVGDTNASEALRVLEEALRRFTAPELEFTGTLDTAIERLDAKRSLIESDLKTLDHDLLLAQVPLEQLAQMADEEEAHKNALRRLEGERQAGFASEVRRQLEENDRHRAEHARLVQEAAQLEAAAQMPLNVEADLRDTVGRYEEAQRNLDTLESRRRDELARERAQIEAEIESLRAYGDYTEDEANRCVALAAELRRVALDDTHHRQQVFILRDQLSGMGYEPERIQFLNARFGQVPDDQQRLLRQQSELNLVFQTEVAGLEQERTQASETLRAVDAVRNSRRIPGWIAIALGGGAALVGGAVFAMKGGATVWAPLAAGGVVLALVGAAVLSIGSRLQAAEREAALRKLSESQGRLNHLRTRRAENEVTLADMSRLMGYRDSVDLMRHWSEYARMLDDSSPLLRAQEQLAQAEARRSEVLREAGPLLRGLAEGPQPGPEALEKIAYEARRSLNARTRLSQLEKSSELVEKERRVDEAAVAGLRERALRILQSAGLAYDPAHSWTQHLDELKARSGQRDRWRMLNNELIPYARQRLMADVEIEQRCRQLEMLSQGPGETAEPRPAADIEVETKQTRTRLEEAQRRRSDLRIEVEEVWRRHVNQRPELEAQLARMTRALARAKAFKESVEIARATIQKVAVDTHRRWADFLNVRVADLLRQFGTRVDHLRFGEDLDFSVQMDGGPQVSRGKAHLQLSTGARDQLYLAVRLAVSEFLSRGGEPLPLLFDDAFASSDDERLRAGMRALVEAFGPCHQIIAVTCHRGRHHVLRHVDPEIFRERVHWIDLHLPVAARS